MSFWRKIKTYGYSEETKEVLRKSEEIRAELRAMTERSKARRRLREEARDSE